MNKIEKIYQDIQEWLRINLGSRITPIFLVMLGLTFILWYAAKLQYTYTTSVTVPITVGDHRHRVECIVEGTGHNIVSTRHFKHKTIKLKYSDVELLPVEGMPNTYRVAPTSLLQALTVHYSELKIISVSDYPFVELH